MNTSGKATKVILKQYKSYIEDPVYGVHLFAPGDDIFKIRGLIMIQDGMYKDITLPVTLRLPEQYPFHSPAMNIDSNVGFDHSFHEHVYNGGSDGHSICCDLLSNFQSYFTSQKASGWSPGFTFKTIMMQMAVFFSDPDLPQHLLPSQEKIQALREQTSRYKTQLEKIYTEQQAEKKQEYDLAENVQALNLNESKNEEQNSTPTVPDHSANKERYHCGILKTNYRDDPNMAYGYGVSVTKDKFGRLHCTPVPEIISNEAYDEQVRIAFSQGRDKAAYFYQTQFTSPMGQPYNCWIPCYIDDEHFRKNYQYICNAISIMKYGMEGKKEYDMNPGLALQIFPTLMNKTIVGLMKGDIHASRSIIVAYVHFLHLFLHFIDRLPKIKQEINKQVRNFVAKEDGRNKRKDCPDIGEFVIKLFLSDIPYSDVKDVLMKEFFTRQIFWMQKNRVDFAKSDHRSLAQDMWKSGEVGNKLLVFNVQMANYLISPGIRERLDAHYGFPPDSILENLQKMITNVQKINNFSTFFSATLYDDQNNKKFPEVKDFIGFITECSLNSDKMGYTNAKKFEKKKKYGSYY